MDNKESESWDEERYLELNMYFKVKIQGMVDGDPYIQKLLRQDKGLELQDLIERMSDHDQQLWEEFIYLDRIKLHMDMRNHLEGRGTPYKPGHGFSSGSAGDREDPQQPW